jgi:galactokinase
MRQAVLRELLDARVIARAPGRVNLIGEHTDYNGFPVLPMAIDRSIWVATAPRAERTLLIRSVEANKFPGEEIPLDQLAQRRRVGTWVDYVVAAARKRPPATGLEMVVAGDVPPEAGLSSSSALVVASLLALSPAGDRTLLAEQARHAERYVGTLSGGMDHAISLLARPGHALRIDFRPVRVEAVAIPASLGVVVADSGVTAAKSGAARQAYNDRVRQCLTAAQLLGVDDGLLADVGERERRRVGAIQDPVLRRRTGFVFDEAKRVEAAVEMLRTGDLPALGALLDASHAGLRDEYEVSHPTVDRLVETARGAGALGARVVGAGFGGCIVAVCERQVVPDLIAAFGARAWRFEAAGPAERCEL